MAVLPVPEVVKDMAKSIEGWAASNKRKSMWMEKINAQLQYQRYDPATQRAGDKT